MALTVAALVPHSPLLIPEIGRTNYDWLAKTTAAYQIIGRSLKEHGVDTLVIISPHGSPSAASFILNVAPEMSVNLQDFGFIPSPTVATGDALLADQIKSALRPDFPLELISQTVLDSGSAIPFYILKNYLGGAQIIVISPAKNKPLADQLKFGTTLHTVIAASDKKIAVIASGDLSHRLKKKSPAGYSPKGAKFDNKIIEYLSEPKTARTNIANLDTNLIKEAGECGLQPLTILLGLLNGRDWQPEILAYQTDFGIGYLSVNFQLT